MALDTIWMAIASILSVYNITKAVDDSGNVITPQVKLKPGTIWYVATVAEDRALKFCVAIQQLSNVLSSQDRLLLWRLSNMLVWRPSDGSRCFIDNLNDSKDEHHFQ